MTTRPHEPSEDVEETPADEPESDAPKEGRGGVPPIPVERAVSQPPEHR